MSISGGKWLDNITYGQKNVFLNTFFNVENVLFVIFEKKKILLEAYKT